MSAEPFVATVVAATPAATRQLGAALAPLCRPGDVVLLIGGLGAGKTTFAQGFAAGLGVEGPVTSPTFTLVRQYPCPDGRAVRQLLHADVYRLGSLGEVADLGLAELVEEDAVALVEWGDAAAPVLGPGALRVVLEPDTAGGGSGAPAGGDDREPRRITVVAEGAVWTQRRGDLAHAFHAGARP